MRHVSFALFCVVLLGSFAAQAGQLSSDNGQGQWVSTECQAPELPSDLSKDAEIPANDLNAQAAAHNVFAAQAKTYMECLKAESERDAGAMGKLIVDAAAVKIDAMTKKVNDSAQAIKTKQGE